jgi:flagellum-specific peptidoglycan hydrolase FlgJ
MKKLIIAVIIISIVIMLNLYESKKNEIQKDQDYIRETEKMQLKEELIKELKLESETSEPIKSAAQEAEKELQKVNNQPKESQQQQQVKKVSTNQNQSIQGTEKEKQFIQTIYKLSNQYYAKYKILNSVTIAQAILESEWGTSKLAIKGNNLFGIKAFGFKPVINFNTGEESKGKKFIINANFRKYNDWDESVSNHHYFLVKENTIYIKAGILRELTYMNQCDVLQRAGYATDSQYCSKLIGLINKHKLYLFD